MKTISYYILLEHGLKRVAGESVDIPNELGMTFGLHCNAYRAFDDELRFVVTHIESGASVGNGTTGKAAINDARVRILKVVERGTLAASLKQTMRERAEVVAANPLVFG